MIVIGIAGGIASGKSLVSAQLEQLGAVVLDADRTAHEVLSELDVKDAIRTRWGAGVFDADGRVDRAAVAKIVFAPAPDGTEQLKFLEQLVHPRIGQRLRGQLDECADRGAAAVALDAAVMFKAGWDRLCDKIVFVDAPREVRLARSRQRGWSESEFDAREAAQLPVAEKRTRADVVIDNSGTPDETRQQIQCFWNSIR